MKKLTFIFRPKMNMLLTYVAAMFSPKNMAARNIDPPKRNHQGASNKSGGSQPSGHRLSKKERKRREHIRHLNPNRKH